MDNNITQKDYIQPYWAKLVIHYNNKGYINNGLTVPFVIGALNVLESGKEEYSVEKIIDSFRHYTAPITLMKCPCIKEYVFNIMDVETKAIAKDYFRRIENIYITDNSLSNINSIQELIEILEKKYSDILKKGLYSRVNRSWNEFDEDDVRKIKESIESPH